ncbi:hypothetical protein [Micromonospora lutea]|uniref:hypothetical protein n=1 Tax=Micromonospora lutea TaxID=419825 RepID=UPI0019523E5D|nr:hypothetical protein [Micromonospora lutea]
MTTHDGYYVGCHTGIKGPGLLTVLLRYRSGPACPPQLCDLLTGVRVSAAVR